MTVSLVYLHVVGLNDGYDPETEKTCGTFEQCAQRFVNTYKEFSPDYDHEVVVVFANGTPPNIQMYFGLPVRFLYYTGNGWCSGAHQYAARNMSSDFGIFLTARTHFWKSGWLKTFCEARETHGDGMYAAHSSCEGGSPHLRTAFYGLNPRVLADFVYPLDSRPASRTLESGEWNISQAIHNAGKPSMLVTWDGVWPMPLWRTPPNIFRRGDQSNCLVLDRHTELYRRASEEEKRVLENITDP